MEPKSKELPEHILTLSKKYFKTTYIQEALTLYRRSKISISFSKNRTDSYYIISGIITDNKDYETKISYKNRLENTPQGPLSSNCNCRQWTPDNHCPHAICLFFHQSIKMHYNENITTNDYDAPPMGSIGNYAVYPVDYGTIINGASKLEGAFSNSTYSSLQYLLHTKKIINFPLPAKLDGKIIICLNYNQDNDQNLNDHFKEISFKYLNASEEIIKHISIFENLYLFNWDNGKSFHIPPEMKDLIQKIRIQFFDLELNELLNLAMPYVTQGLCLIRINNVFFDEIPKQESEVHLSLAPDEKKQIKCSINYVTIDTEKVTLVPHLLKNLTFIGGLLHTFRRKIDAYDFIRNLLDSVTNKNVDYKKHISQLDNRVQINNMTNAIVTNEIIYLFDKNLQSVISYKKNDVVNLLMSIHKYFGDLFFRFSIYHHEENTLEYKLSSRTMFEGINGFYSDLKGSNIKISYNRNQLTNWSSKVKFERRSSTTKWFDLELNISGLDLEIINNANPDNSYALTKSGIIILNNDQKKLLRFIKKYTEYEKRAVEFEEETKTKKFVLPFNRSRIFELFELRKLGIDGALTNQEIELCEKLSTFSQMPTYELPSILQGVLRPYQVTGFNWLRFLYENKLGACLADDMGLGKTLQAISLILSLYEKIDKVLVICPVTILINWENEIKKFSNMPSYIYHGGVRSIPKDVKIILTSYGVMKKEAETTFADMTFDILILDEVQNLKNIRSLGAYAARKIKSNFTISMTGTPVENDLSEFYNIIDLSVPGVWGDLHFIRTTSTKKTRLLAKKTASPYILRRTKDQVLTDLPPKINNTVYLEFDPEEKSNYIKTLLNIKNRINVSPSRKKYGEILKGLLELRQSCLWQHGAKEYSKLLEKTLSTKINFLIEQLEQIIEEKHQTIIFSQFTTYLDIIQKTIIKKGWDYVRIDGTQSIKKRQTQVDQFQNGDAPIFLISLKAGGVGLNLTAASYVFIMDPWWNPAVENQAIDRAHRIGQKNRLNVYKLIIKGSVEEKVLELQKAKIQLFNELLSSDDDNYFTGKLTMHDFEHLLA